MSQPRSSRTQPKPRRGRPPLVPGGLRAATFTLSRDNRAQLEDVAARLRMSKAEAVRVAIEDLWSKVLTCGTVES